MPAVNPVTTPPLVIVATDGLALTQVPVPPSESVVVPPTHILGVPVIVPALGRTVTDIDADEPPQGLLIT